VVVNDGGGLGAVPAATPTYTLRTISAPVTTDPAFPWRPA
jgi:hypothetical protein